MDKVKSFLRSLRANDNIKRILHTAWQVGVPFLASHLLIARSSADVKTAFVATGAVVLAALKAALVAKS